jgi:hypothetical protein
VDHHWFDDLTRIIGTPISRRKTIRALLGTTLAGVFSFGAAEEAAACVRLGKKCGQGTRCCAGAPCKRGRCRCKKGLTKCGKVCRDLRADATNCGKCGVTCVSGQTCAGGACTCDNQSCTGCCDGASCRSGDTDALCGAGGGVCRQCATGETCQNGVCACTKRSCPRQHVCAAAGSTCQTCSAQTADPACHVFDPANSSPATCGSDPAVPGALCVCLTTPTGAACVRIGGNTCFTNQSTCTTDSDCDQFYPGTGGVCVTGCANAVGLNCGGNGNACALRCGS